jgi:sigma-B regulation protein RsbU (phosphoserine phosphatase)
VIEIAENGLLLAAADDATYTEKSMTLDRGDRLLLYTDGLLEARNGEGRLFGEESLAGALRDTAALAPAAAVERIIAEVQRWATSQEDDLTAVLCDFVGTT